MAGKSKRADGKQRGNIFKRGGSWAVRVKVKGRQIWRSAPTYEGAQKILGELREDIAADKVGFARTCRKTLRDFAPDFLKWAKANKRSWERDERSVNKALLPALGNLRLNEITRARVQAYQRDRQKEVSGATINREVACLRKLLNCAVEQGELSENPTKGTKMLAESPARIPALSPGDEAALVAAAKGSPWLPNLIRLAVLTGCRQGELLALRWRHVDFDGRALLIEDSKAGTARRVPLHPSALALLRPLRGTPDGFVFVGRGGVPPTTNAVVQAFRRACDRAIEAARRRHWRAGGKGDPPDLPALDGFRFHDLRHVAGTRLLATGASLPEVAAVLGHKTLAMSRRYAHATWTRLEALIGAMPANGTEGGQA